MRVECPVCHRTWEKGCQQETIIAKHGSCAVCRYVEKPPEGMTEEKCEAEFREMFGPGDYFPKSKPRVNVGVIGEPRRDRMASLAAAMIHADHHIEVDTEASTELQRKALEGATRAVAMVGGGYASEDGTKRSLAEIVKASEASGKKLVVIDSIHEDAEALSKTATKSLLASATAAAVAGMVGEHPWGFAKGKKSKQLQKCGLSGCDKMHDHNGGYCCPEHCREHRKMQKNRVGA